MCGLWIQTHVTDGSVSDQVPGVQRGHTQQEQVREQAHVFNPDIIHTYKYTHPSVKTVTSKKQPQMISSPDGRTAGGSTEEQPAIPEPGAEEQRTNEKLRHQQATQAAQVKIQKVTLTCWERCRSTGRRKRPTARRR